jgi:hypothetical protein
VKRKKALELQEAWGDQPCPHPTFAKEYDLGVRTGNFICTQCGRSFTVREKVAIMAERKEAEAPSAGDDIDTGAPSGEGTP